ncbi:MAG: 2,4-dihydroxyhept-2-ene-1,7-dioic acid aldolase, partial [Leifsonia sp.]|nr:2,4-dihydroxyhept-2-ene-1,7-dioic acid aldolase [Leifsonia sp.]
PPLITPTEAGLEKMRAYLEQGEAYLTPADGYQIGGAR